ncbi:hypothetical protein FNJ84_00400 [Paracoccus sp. M683]|uniref:caspase family protein n=1 Tax=Paracoccus sp. M683 TaxID=2594268 RepID=UPI00117FDC4D|nr:caspase family protein [Paracoccus sp. M683]TRW99179.1 hypothetical protein FNJ84_00400 [Paracoccus sp. M683]
MPQPDEYRILRSLPEIEAFFARINAYTTADDVLAQIEPGQPLDRIGGFAELARKLDGEGAAAEIIAEQKRAVFGRDDELPHLLVLPSGWVAVLRYLGGRDDADRGVARVRVAICPADPADGDTIRDSLARVLLGLQDGVGAPAGQPPLPGRHEGDWPDELTSLFDRDAVEAAYADLLASRVAAKDQAPHQVRRAGDVVDDLLRWFGTISKPGSATELDRRQARGDGTRPPAQAVDLKLHVINMRFGQLSARGPLHTSASDVKAIAEAAKLWIGARAGRRLAIYAHGGLVAEAQALAHARQTAQWWLDNDVYPVFCIWESDAATTILQLIRELLGGDGGRDGRQWWGEARDAAIERLVHATGQPVWDVMKRSAMMCSADGLQHGLTLLARRLKGAFAGSAAPPIDLIGHSAGAIVLLPFLGRLKDEGLVPASFQMLAPAATNSLYRDYLAAYGSKKLKIRIYAMQDTAERADTVAGVYGKSLLYLVSRGFEDHFGEPISGLQKDLLADRQLIALMCRWCDGETRKAMVFSPTPEGTPRRLASGAVMHGGFDTDQQTMWSVMALIRGEADEGRITPFPADLAGQRSGGADPLRLDLPEEVRLYLNLAATPTPAAAPVAAMPNTPTGTATGPASPAAPASARQPARRALTIGINDYAQMARLAGCVRDSDTWRDLLHARGFDVTQLAQPELTGRDQIIAALRDFVAQSGAGDTLVWHFSGHGMKIETILGTEDDFETTGFDQAIIASNASEGLTGQLAHTIIDDDIHAILQGLHPQADCYVFLDSCFSGTATKLDLPGTPRSMGVLRLGNRVARNRPLTAPMEAASRGGPYDGANHVLFSAAAATQKAIENGDPVQGVFTRAVSQLLAQPATALTNASFCLRINDLMPGSGQTSGVFCDPSRLNRPFPLAGV